MITKERIGQRDCHRCGGFMVEEEAKEIGTVLRRCVMCGERIDPIILQHRRKGLSRKQAESLFAQAQKAPLN